MFLVSDINSHTLDPKLDIRMVHNNLSLSISVSVTTFYLQIKKRASKTSLPLYFTDVTSAALVKNLVDSRFDDGTTYETAEVCH